jgi:hypothetical protein
VNTIHNEGIKLLASTLNSLGIASIVTGAVAPIASFVYGLGQPASPGRLFGAIVAWLVVGEAYTYRHKRF